MPAFDLPAANRIGIGFDRFFKALESAASEAASNVGGYPPYNIERSGDDQYLITLALAGFSSKDVEINVADGVLRIKGEIKDDSAVGEVLYRGIATRAFERVFKLADYVEVKSATFDNGMLRIYLLREVPESKKARKIEIGVA